MPPTLKPKPRPDGGSLAPEFAFLLANAGAIRGLARKAARGTSLDVDDLHSRLRVDLVETFGKFRADPDDPDRGVGNWIFMRARNVRRSMVREAKRNEADGIDRVRASGQRVYPEPAVAAVGFGHHGRVEARVELAMALARPRLLPALDREEGAEYRSEARGLVQRCAGARVGGAA